jgi:IS5 family transposase
VIIVVATTVQPKAIAHPTDSRLLNRAREQLVDEAKANGIELRQSYARVGPRAEQQAGRYAHARQFRRMRGQLRTLRGWLGRGIRDVGRKARTPYEFGIKVSVAVTAKEGLVVGMRSMPGNPPEATAQAATGRRTTVVARGASLGPDASSRA